MAIRILTETEVEALLDVIKQMMRAGEAPEVVFMPTDDFRKIAKEGGKDDAWIESYIERHTVEEEKN